MGDLASFFIAGLGAALFIVLTAMGGKADWSSLVFWYGWAVGLTAYTGLIRPRGLRNPAQLGTRILTPLALAGLAELALLLKGSFEPFGALMAMVFYLAVWLSVLAAVFLAVAEDIWRRREPDHRLGSFSDFVFGLMDRIYLTRPLDIKLGGGEVVEMVIEASPWTTVYEALWKRFWLALKWGVGLGFALATFYFVGASLFQLQSFLSGEVNLTYPWWLIITGPVILGLPLLIWTYFIEEWNRRQTRYVFCTGKALVVKTRAPEGVVYLSFGPTALLEEVKMHSPGEKVGQENPSFLGRFWDGFLWWYRGVADLFLPSKVFGAADDLAGVEHAFGTFKVLEALAKGAKDRGLIRDTASRVFAETAVLEEKSASGWATSERQADQVIAALNRLQPPGPMIDLRTVRDPGRWDRQTGERIVGTAEAPATLSLKDFPQDEPE